MPFWSGVQLKHRNLHYTHCLKWWSSEEWKSKKRPWKFPTQNTESKIIEDDVPLELAGRNSQKFLEKFGKPRMKLLSGKIIYLTYFFSLWTLILCCCNFNCPEEYNVVEKSWPKICWLGLDQRFLKSTRRRKLNEQRRKAVLTNWPGKLRNSIWWGRKKPSRAAKEVKLFSQYVRRKANVRPNTE